MEFDLEPASNRDIEINVIMLIYTLQSGDAEKAMEMANDLLQLVKEQKCIHDDWRALLFKMANKF